MIYDSVSGEMISQRMQRIQDIIQDYEPTLELAWIPPKSRTFEDNATPFAVIHRPVGKPEYIVMLLREDEVNETLLARLWTNDNTKHNVLSQVEAMDAARKAVRLKEQMDAAELRNDITSHIIHSPKVAYRHDGVKYV
jgi:hypothetical protein